MCVSFSPRDRANLALTGDLHVPSWWGNYIASPRLIEVSVAPIACTQSLSPQFRSVNPPQANILTKPRRGEVVPHHDRASKSPARADLRSSVGMGSTKYAPIRASKTSYNSSYQPYTNTVYFVIKTVIRGFRSEKFEFRPEGQRAFL